MERKYTHLTQSTASTLLLLLILLVAPRVRAQVLLDDFNRTNSNTVGGGWTEVQSNGNDATGARVNGNELILQEPNNNTGREYVWQNAPTSYSSTLSQNNCTLTWAFSFRQTEDETELTGFDSGDDGLAVVLAGTASDLTTGNGYAVVLGETGTTDRLRLVRYTGGLDADANLTNIITAGNFATERLDVRVTYVPSTNTWNLYYNDNGGDSFADPLSAATSAGSAVNNTYTGTALGFLGVLWNHDGDNGQFGRLDNFYVPAGRPTVPVITPSSATICSNGSTGLSASATTGSSTARVTFYSSGGPSNVSTSGANNGSVYPWGVNVSGIPTSGITVESVTINGVSHTYPDDLDILLQSPTGTNVILMSDIGGATDITSNTYTFMDGATAMADDAINGSGYYRPTNSGTPDSWPTAPGPNSLSQTTPTLSMFTGNPTGTWNLLIRDDANNDGGSVTSWSITFTFTNTVSYTWSPATGLSATTGASVTANPTSTQVYTVTAGHGANSCTQSANVTVTVVTAPTTATVGSNQTICAGGSTTGLGGNTPTVGSGSWSVVSGGTGTFSPNNTTPNATFNHTGGAGPITLRWTITGTPPCVNSTADVSITISQPPTTATVGSNQTICANGTTTGLGGNAPSVGSGSWSVVSGGTGTFNPNNTTPNATFTHTGGTGPIVVRWTISNSPCTSSQADVSISISQPATAATVGGGQTICANGTSTGLGGNTPAVGTGAWSVVSGGTGTFSPDNTAPNATFNHTGGTGPVVVRWTITPAPPCAASSADVSITINQSPTTATVGSNQTICANGTTTGLGGNAPSVGSGSWSVVSGGTGTFNPNNTTPNATFTHTGGTGPVVLQWQIANAPCVASSATLSVTINAAPTTATVGGDQTICANHTTAGLGANSPSVGTGAWSVVSGGTGTFSPDANTPNATFTHIGGAGPVVLRWTISNPPCAPSTADATITISATCTYYSQSTGNVTDNIWSTLPVGTPGPAFWGASSNMVVKAGHVVTNTSNVGIGSCTVNGSLVLGAAATLTVNSGGLSGTGSLTANDNSELQIAGSNPAGISLPGTLSFWNLTISNSNITTANSFVDIRGTLQLNGGTFDAGTNKVSLRSTATYTGRLGPVNPAATYSGNMRIERYVPAGATNWRLLGSPITNRRVGNWNDDFTTAGFPGSHVPWFDQPVGSGILWPSIRWYDETNTGAGTNDGMTGVSSNTQPLTLGQGFAAWCGTTLTTTTAFTIDLENSSPVIANSPITLPMTYTNTGVPAVDGWNLVSNPLPSPIAFDQIARGADVADYITYFNPAAGNMASYDISSGVSVNGGTNIIQSMQGFYLKATGPAVTTTVDESDKVESNNGGFFGGLEDGVPAVLHLTVSSSINSFSDETLVVFSEGEPEVNSNDVPKYIWSHPDAPQIASIGAGGEIMAINAYGPYSTAISIPLMVDAGVTGDYTLTATGLEGMGLSCLSIEDLLTGTVTPLAEGAIYTFGMEASADATAPRLMLHATAPLPFMATSVSCHGLSDGQATVEIANGVADVAWLSDAGAVISEFIGASGAQTLNDLAPGDYQVQVDGFGGCGTLTHVFTIEEPEIMAVDGTTMDATCSGAADGQVVLNVSGGTAPYAYQWSNGDTDTTLVASEGDYAVNVTDSHGCTVQSGMFSIGSGTGPTAAVDAQSTVVTVNEPVLFFNNSSAGVSCSWDFGDGVTSTDTAPVHAYALPGEYTVTLSVNEGMCMASTTITITVETSTGIEVVDDVRVAAWMNGDNLMVEHGFTDLEPVQVELLNEAGQLFRQLKVAGPSGRLSIPAADLASGIWYVRVSNLETRRTIPVVIVR